MLIALGIFSVFILLWIIPFSEGKYGITWSPGFYHVKDFFLKDTKSKWIMVLFILNLLFIFFSTKNISSKFYILYYTSVTIVFMKYFYPFHGHHFLYFVFTNVIVLLWIILSEENVSFLRNNYYLVIFLLLFFAPIKDKIFFHYIPSLKPVAEYINKNNFGKIFNFTWF